MIGSRPSFTPPTLISLTSSAAAMPADAMSASAARQVLETNLRMVYSSRLGLLKSPDEPQAQLNSSGFLDCPEARMGGVGRRGWLPAFPAPEWRSVDARCPDGPAGRRHDVRDGGQAGLQLEIFEVYRRPPPPVRMLVY